MNATDPILLVSAAALVGIFLAPWASRLIGRAAAATAAELGSDDTDQSRIRRR